jgi:glycosyltransferase involved in cell wall biosynthesis
LYPEFDTATYAANNGDLTNFTPEELMSHYHHYGRNEGRIYKRNTSKLILKAKPKATQKKVQTVLPPTDNYIDINNFRKISQFQEINDEIYLDQILIDVLKKKDADTNTSPIYLILSEWGYPPFGGGECWLIDTARWMRECGFACYYIYFNDPIKNADFSHYEVTNNQGCTYIKFLRDNTRLLRFIRLLNPAIISHQGLKRMDFMKIANLLEKPFITGFCFWQDIIKMTPTTNGDVFNQRMITKDFVPDENFAIINKNASACYVASPFMADIVTKVHNVQIPIINTVSDDAQFKIIKPDNNVYVTVVNICGLKGGNILESIINNTNLNIPFLLIDSQESDGAVNKRLQKLLTERNAVENPHKSVYIKGCVTDMKHIYQQTRILLIPTLVDETFCRVAYEGMMNSLPILATNNGNLKYLVKGYADFMEPTAECWYNKINDIYGNEELLQGMRFREKPINPIEDKGKFISMVQKCVMNSQSNYLSVNSVGILCPWADQGLGIQCREYYEILEKCGYGVSVYSFKPYQSKPTNPKLQADSSEWDYPNIYYGSEFREYIDADDFITYLHKYRVKKMIIVETCYPKVFELARICNMLSIQVIAIPNLETLRYSEIHTHEIFDKIICNNHMTYDILSKYFPTKATLIGFRILNNHFSSEKKLQKGNTLFCSGGLNALSRKNIDKILTAFKELETENKLSNFKLHVYIQGNEVPTHLDKLKSANIIISVSQKSYKEIVDLYKTHDIFIHMGDHEGLGLGFYESLACGTPVFTIDTPPNNEIIRDGINGWVVRCGYTPLTDNKEGIVQKAAITSGDIKVKLYSIIQSYDRHKMMASTIMDYATRYPISVYSDQIKKMF